MKKLFKITLIVVLCIGMCICAFACKEEQTGLWKNATYTEDTALGDGSKKITVEISAEEKSIQLTIKTDKATLGDALKELKLADNQDGMIITLNGMRADYNKDGAYWGIFDKDGNYLMQGSYETEISGGEGYKFVHTPA